MYTYQLTNTIGNIILRSDGASIPPDQSNIDYIAYLAWIESGGIPLPAENT
jgi:hypothetical protein